jgi:hypothetical protein
VLTGTSTSTDSVKVLICALNLLVSRVAALRRTRDGSCYTGEPASAAENRGLEVSFR